MTANLETAMYLASLGFHIAPLPSDTKKPQNHWHHQSTRDDTMIREWFIDPFMGWPQSINILIDCGKSGLTVVDVDVKDGKGGAESWAEWMQEYGPLPNTFTVRTPSGGLHFYFLATGYRNSVGKVAPGIDIRAEGGLVIAPSSDIDGVPYEIIDESMPAEMPDWLHEKLSAYRVGEKSAGVVYTADDPGDVQWALDYLAGHDGAVEGAGGDHHTFVTFCVLKEHGIGPETALALMLEHWNDKCSPPWDYEDLEKKRDSAYKSAHNATGAKSAAAEFKAPTRTAAATPQLVVNNAPQEAITVGPWAGFKVLDYIASADIPPRDWVLGDIAVRGNVTVLGAPPGASKTTLTMLWALQKTTGRDLAGIFTRGIGRVGIINNEDPLMEMRRRIAALMDYYRVSWDELLDGDGMPRLFLSSGEQSPFRIARRGERSGKIIADNLDAICAYVTERRLDILVVDPFAEVHPANENDNGEMNEIGQLFRLVAWRCNCAVILVHHTRKLDAASSDGHSGNLDAIRGASALGGVARIVLTLFQMSEKQAKKYGVKPQERWKYVLLEQAKGNLTAGDANLMWYRKEPQAIGVTAKNPDGENIGVLRPVSLASDEDLKPEIRTLLRDIEALIEDAPMRISDIAKELVACFPFHQGKNPRSLERSISRLFGEEDTCTAITGTLFLEEEEFNGRQIKTVRFHRLMEEPVSKTIAEML